MTDFRALCAEQAENVRYLLDCVADGDSDPVAIAECVQHLGFTRAALAQPEGHGLTEDQLDVLVIAIQALIPSPNPWGTHSLAAVDRGREILQRAFARWGRPAASAVEVGEVVELVSALKVIDKMQQEWVLIGDDDDGTASPSMSMPISLRRFTVLRDALTRAATLLQQQAAPAPAPKPIPVSERLPEDDDCLVIPPLGASTFPLRCCWQAREIIHCGQARLIWDWKLVPHTTDKHWPFTYWLPASTRFLPTAVDPAQPT
jgi:hypothetical protein